MHANSNFLVSHMVISEVIGTFKEYACTVIASYDDFCDAQINVSINEKALIRKVLNVITIFAAQIILMWETIPF